MGVVRAKVGVVSKLSRAPCAHSYNGIPLYRNLDPPLLVQWILQLRGVLTYIVNPSDFHLPSVCMNKSLNPALAAVVAAPILKLIGSTAGATPSPMPYSHGQSTR